MMRSPLFSDLLSLRHSLDQFVNQGFGSDTFRSGSSRAQDTASNWAFPMPIDVYATNDHAVVLAAVPGMTPDDLELSIHQNTVTLSGTVHNAADSEDAKDATWYVAELGGGTYRRSVTLPFPVDADQASATFQHGIVRVLLPKVESAKPRKIAITESGDHALAANKATPAST